MLGTIIRGLQEQGGSDLSRLLAGLGLAVTATGLSGYGAFHSRISAQEFTHRADILEGVLVARIAQMTTKQ